MQVIVFIAKYTYDPLKYSPNDNPELELSVTKGDYVYIHGDMDDDGFFEGELLSGHRGLVPSNFVEPVNEKELPDLLKSHLQKLRNRSLSNLHLNQIAAGNYGLNPKGNCFDVLSSLYLFFPCFLFFRYFRI